MEGVILGIDLGTRYSIMAVVDERGTRVVKNRWGEDRTSSYVAYGDDKLYAANEAASLFCLHPDRACPDLKRRLGASKGIRLGNRFFKPSELLQVLLIYLREDAEAFSHSMVNGGVIAVPSSFDFKQREIVRDAARMAGFYGVKLVNEPTAIAMSSEAEGCLLVIDFGAGSADISAIEKKDGFCHVLDSVGNADFGGASLDKIVARHLWELIDKREDPERDERWPLLLAEAERIKEALSFSNKAYWFPKASGFECSDDTSITVRREDIEGLLEPNIVSFLDMAKDMWKQYECQTVLLAGGSSRIPLFRRLLSRFFGETLNIRVCPDEAVALGAARLARGEGEALIDVLSCDLCIGTAEGGVTVVASKGTPLPLKLTKRFMVVGAGAIDTEVLQRKEYGLEVRDEPLCSLSIKEANPGDVVKIVFTVDGSGILNIKITNDKGKLYMSRDVSVRGLCSQNSSSEERKKKIIELEKSIVPFSYLFDPNLERKVKELFDYLKVLQDAEEELWQDAVSILESVVDRISRAVKNR